MTSQIDKTIRLFEVFAAKNKYTLKIDRDINVIVLKKCTDFGYGLTNIKIYVCFENLYHTVHIKIEDRKNSNNKRSSNYSDRFMYGNSISTALSFINSKLNIFANRNLYRQAA